MYTVTIYQDRDEENAGAAHQIYSQSVSDIDLPAVIRAINGMGARFSALENEIECLRKIVIALSIHTPSASAMEEKR